MMILLWHNHILFKLSARLLIIASILCVLFGYGTHLHINVAFDHGDIQAHTIVHVHSNSSHPPTAQGHDHTPNHHTNPKNDATHTEHDQTQLHQHDTATVDLAGTLSQNASTAYSDHTNLFSAPAVLAGLFDAHTISVWYLDLPPPDLLWHSDSYSSFSLRGPPLA